MSATIIITGNVGQDAEERFTQNGTKIAEFSIANNWKKGEEKITNWYRVSAFGQMADWIIENIRKGDRCQVVGMLKVNEGDKTYLNVTATQWPEKFIAGKSGEPSDEDVPF